jgi:hypothetical protein
VLTFLLDLLAFMREDRINLSVERRAMFIQQDARERR